MKKLIKITIAIVLVVSMAFVTFGYTIDEKMKEKHPLKYYLDQDGTWGYTNGSGDEHAYDVVNNTIRDDEEKRYGGFSISLGEYPQDDLSGMTKQPIKWIILEKSNGKALLISNHILDKKEYNDVKGESTTWETSSLRKWLNNDFYNLAFDSSDKERIVPYTLTGDNVFILSEDEAKNYFRTNKLSFQWGTDYSGLLSKTYFGNPWLAAKLTNYAESKKGKIEAKTITTNTKAYWLRNMKDDKVGYFVGNIPSSSYQWIAEAEMRKNGDEVNPKFANTGYAHKLCGIRPCIWITIDENVISDREQALEDLAGGIGKQIIGGALDSVIPGSSLLIP